MFQIAIFFAQRSFGAPLAAITLAALALRLAAARGDLWLDEIWSLQLISDLPGPLDIVLGLPNDNNHILNSLWLWAVGAQAPPLLLRLQSILCGTAAVPVAALLARRTMGARAGLIAATTIAFGYIFVVYSSEARGYAGLILCALLCLLFADQWLDEPTQEPALQRFALVGAIGMFCHLTMLLPLALMCAAATWHLLRTDKRPWSAIARLASAATLAVLPALACLAISAWRSMSLIRGHQNDFFLWQLTTGLGDLARFTLGLPQDWSLTLCASLMGLIALAAIWGADARKRALLCAVFIGFPLAAIVAHIPNVGFARFHLFMGLVLALALAGLLSALSQRRLWLACALGGLMLAGQAMLLTTLLGDGRGQPSAAVAMMEADGPAQVASNMPREAIRLLRFYQRDALLTPAEPDCANPPRWQLIFVAQGWYGEPLGQQKPPFGPPTCPHAYERVGSWPTAPLTGSRLDLYRILTL